MNHYELLTIKQRLQHDKRLVEYDKKIGFVALFQKELADKKGFLRLKDLDKKQLIIAYDIHYTIKKSNEDIATDPLTHKLMAKAISYEFSNPLNKQQRASLRVYDYYAGENFIYSRDDFLNRISGVSAPFIDFPKGPADLGTVSIILRDSKEYNEITWIDHNLFFILDAQHIDSKQVLDIAYWV